MPYIVVPVLSTYNLHLIIDSLGEVYVDTVLRGCELWRVAVPDQIHPDHRRGAEGRLSQVLSLHRDLYIQGNIGT